MCRKKLEKERKRKEKVFEKVRKIMEILEH